MCRYGARRFKDGPARFLRPRSPRRRSRRPASARHTRSRVVWAFRGEGQARRCTPHAGRHRDAHPAPAGVVCAGRRTCIAEKRRCEWRFLATVARRARRTATHTTISVRKTTYVRHSRPEASANSASSAPRQRQIELRAASSLGQPRPASASLGQPRPIWQACSGCPALPALLSTRGPHLQLLVYVGHVNTEADEGERGDTDVEDVAALPPEGAALPHHSKRGVSHEACARRRDKPLRPLLPLRCTVLGRCRLAPATPALLAHLM